MPGGGGGMLGRGLDEFNQGMAFYMMMQKFNFGNMLSTVYGLF